MINYIEEQLPFHNRKRVEFVYSTITENMPKHKEYKILDVGCGTGELFTVPLAVRLQGFESVKILGIDIHPPSIERATHHIDSLSLKNLAFECKPIDEIKDTYDCICLMAVLEHLTDPETMLAEIRKKVSPNGLFILYIPNGHGSYEIESAIFRKLMNSKLTIALRPIYRCLRGIKHILLKRIPSSSSQKVDTKGEDTFIIKGTLNALNDVHIQFFGLKEVRTMLGENGFPVKAIFKSRLLAGPFSTRLLLHPKIIEGVNKIADKVPATIASDWTFVCTLEE